MNLLGSSLILAIIAKATGYTAGVFTHSMTDVHFYENQLDAIDVQLGRIPLESPSLTLPSVSKNQTPITYIEELLPEEVLLWNYKHHPALPKVDMAQEK